MVEFLGARYVFRQNDPLFRFDGRLGWMLQESLEAGRVTDGKKWSIHTNDRGERIGWDQPAKGACGSFVALLGDSFVFGQGVDFRDRFDNRISAPPKFLNLGVMGYSPLQAFLRQRENFKNQSCVSVSRIVFFIFENDIRDAQTSHTALRFRPILKTGRVHYPDGFWHRIHGWLGDESLIYHGFLFVLQDYFGLSVFSVKVDMDDAGKLTEGMNYAAQNAGVRPVTFVLHGFEPMISQKILGLPPCKGGDCIDLGISRKTHPRLYFESNRHWNRTGHLFVAELLKKILSGK